jgi:hypothetical protein
MRALVNLGDVLFGRARGAILAFLYAQPGQAFYYREITREAAGLSPGTIQRELAMLCRLELVTRSVNMRKVYYRANSAHRVFPELRLLLGKTVGAVCFLRAALDSIENEILLAFIYGDAERLHDQSEADIEIVIVGDLSLAQVLEALANTDSLIGRHVKPKVFSGEDFQDKLTRGDPVVMSLASGDKVFLIGNSDWFKRDSLERPHRASKSE